MRLCAWAILLGLAACTGALEPGVASQPIVGGSSTSGDPAVVLLIGQHPGSMLATLCTATIVSPHVLLTAAHCVSPDTVGSDAQFSVYLGDNLDNAHVSDLIAVKEVHAHPDFSAANVQNGADIAVVIMNDPLSPPPVAMNRTALTGSLVGQAVRMIGYGKTVGTDSTGATVGQRRVADTVMDGYSDKLVRVGQTGITTCEGDSGGPALMTIEGQEVIVGLVSFGDKDCTDISYDTRVDVYADDWVVPFIEKVDPGAVPPVPHHGCGFAAPMARSAFPVSCFLFPVSCFLFRILRRRRRLSS